MVVGVPFLKTPRPIWICVGGENKTTKKKKKIERKKERKKPTTSKPRNPKNFQKPISFFALHVFFLPGLAGKAGCFPF